MGLPLAFFRRHPFLLDALLWALPAIVAGAILRCWLMAFSPYAYFGSDSKSFYGFAYGLLAEGEFSLYSKRRYIYPIFLLLLSLLPGCPLQWIAWFQHALGLAILVPLAYVVRKTCLGWKAWVIPVTLLYGCTPMIFWYEHEVIAETLFFNAVILAMAGWVAWVPARATVRGQMLFWWFFAGFAALMLTKPSARFFVPGLVLGLAAVLAWKHLNRKHAIAAAALVALSSTVGQESQGAWLLYFSAFPLTRLDTPKHADYKAEIRDLVEKKRAEIHVYGITGDEIFEFLDAPDEHPGRPLWAALEKDDALRTRIYNDLAKEAILGAPHLFLYISLQRLALSANPVEFKDKRFTPEYYAEKFERLWKEEDSDDYFHFLFGTRRGTPRPPFEEVAVKLAPASGRAAGDRLLAYVGWYNRTFELLHAPDNKRSHDDHLYRYRIAPFGWILAAGIFCTLLPAYWRSLGVWTVTICGYLVGVFLVGGDNARYFGAAWPMMAIWAVMPAEVLWRTGLAAIRSRTGARTEAS